MRESAVECDLTALCLQYLTFACFDQDISEEKLLEFTIKGYFAFQDYAIANWSHHYCKMVEAGWDLITLDSDTNDAIQELAHAINDFANNYENEILQETIEGSAGNACEAFKECHFYNSLRLLWSHINWHQQRGFDARNDVSLKGLGEALSRSRRLLEDPATPANCSSPQRVDLDSFYGDRRYKCPKLTCFYFHEGFKDANSRLDHVNRHDRPFRCKFPDCSVTDIGFVSSKQLDKHTKSFHPELNDQAAMFAVTNIVPTRARKWTCHLCDKSFTRGFHLRSHIRNHNDQRPFACSSCGKAFTRDNDCKRHQKIHARRQVA